MNIFQCSDAHPCFPGKREWASQLLVWAHRLTWAWQGQVAPDPGMQSGTHLPVTWLSKWWKPLGKALNITRRSVPIICKLVASLVVVGSLWILLMLQMSEQLGVLANRLTPYLGAETPIGWKILIDVNSYLSACLHRHQASDKPLITPLKN